MLEAFIHGLFNQFHPTFFGVLFLGVVIGIFLGVVPAISGFAGMALLLPIVYGWDKGVAFAFLLAIQGVSCAGGAITAILLGIPGDSPNAATVIDGYALTKIGDGGRAIGAALTGSSLAGVLAVFFAFLLIPGITPVVLSLHMPEMFFIMLLGLSFVAVLGSGSHIKGFISGGLGISASFIGYQATSGIPRFTFGSSYLIDGLGIIPVTLGLFAGVELMELAVYQRTIARDGDFAPPRMQMLQGVKDFFKHIPLWLRSTVVGYIVGVIPGIGCNIASFVSYGQAKHSAKEPDKFGKGAVEGVIAPESANAAVSGGALLTTLSFGIPGSATMAVLLAAYLMVGITPGVRLLTENPELSFTMLWAVAISNMLGGVLCFLIAPYLIRVTKIHPHYIMACVSPIIFISAYSVNGSMVDIIVVLIFTGIGIWMNNLGYSRPAFILGFILGKLFEQYFWFSIKLEGQFFFLRPISLALITVLILLLCLNPIKSAVRSLLLREHQANEKRP